MSLNGGEAEVLSRPEQFFAKRQCFQIWQQVVRYGNVLEIYEGVVKRLAEIRDDNPDYA